MRTSKTRSDSDPRRARQHAVFAASHANLWVRLGVLVVTAVALWPTAARASWQTRGFVAIEGRAFMPDQKSASQDINAGIASRLEIMHKHGDIREKVRAFGRLDGLDGKRNLVFVEEAWIGFRHEPVEIKVGYDLINWTATEAFHPADVINARNFDSNLENLEKLGELMASMSVDFFNGQISAYYMPHYGTPRFASPKSRMSFAPPGVSLGSPVLLDRHGRIADDRWGTQWALRMSQTFGSADIAIHVLQHMDRTQPRIFLSNTLVPTPLFQFVTQFGLTYQHAVGPVVLKVEMAHRIFDQPPPTVFPGFFTPFRGGTNPNHTIIAAGIEYGIPHTFGESTFLAEAQGIAGVTKQTRASLSLFQMDAMLGYRLGLNDADSTELLLLTIFDLERRNEMMLSASYSQRLGDTWRIGGGARVIFAPPKGQTPQNLEVLNGANQLFVNLTRYF